MNEKEIITKEINNGVQYLVRLKGYKSKQKIKIKSPSNTCLNSFMCLSENHLNIELKIPVKNKKDLELRAKCCTSPISTKVYQKLFKLQTLKENEELTFEITRKKGITGLFNIDLTFVLYFIRPKENDDIPKE